MALLGIVVTIGIVAESQRVGAAGHRGEAGLVAEHCEGLTIPTVDHFPLINAG